MRKTTSALLALCALAALAGRADDEAEPADAKAGLKKVRGTWAVTKTLVQGEERTGGGKLTYTFDSDKLTWRSRTAKGPGRAKWGGVTVTYKVKVDTRKKPYTIELTPERIGRGQPELKGKGQPGLFKVEKGLLYPALRGRAGPPRPGGRAVPARGTGGRAARSGPRLRADRPGGRSFGAQRSPGPGAECGVRPRRKSLMKNVLRLQVTGPWTERCIGWLAGAAILTLCSVLIALALPTVPRA